MRVLLEFWLYAKIMLWIRV